MKADRPDQSNPKHPFVAPEGYFADLPTRLQQRINGPAASPSTLGLLPRWAYVMVGIFAIAAVSVWLVTRPTTPMTQASAPSAEQLLAEVPTETLVDYLLLAEVDVMSSASLSEAEQEALLEQLDASDNFYDFSYDENN
ncbi:MAG: hypothetical protein WA958_13925 [Tunicatimonas sp.]